MAQADVAQLLGQYGCGPIQFMGNDFDFERPASFGLVQPEFMLLGIPSQLFHVSERFRPLFLRPDIQNTHAFEFRRRVAI